MFWRPLSQPSAVSAARSYSARQPRRRFHATPAWLYSDPHRVLGLRPGADPDHIKKAYRREAMRWHPDRNPGEKRAEAEKKFKEVTNAYESLTGGGSYNDDGNPFGPGGPFGSGFGGPGAGNVSPEEAEQLFRQFFGDRPGSGFAGSGGFTGFGTTAGLGGFGDGESEIEVEQKPDGTWVAQLIEHVKRPDGTTERCVTERRLSTSEADLLHKFSDAQEKAQAAARERDPAKREAAQEAARRAVSAMMSAAIKTAVWTGVKNIATNVASNIATGVASRAQRMTAVFFGGFGGGGGAPKKK